MQMVGLQKVIPIPSLAEPVFGTTLDELDSAALLVRVSLNLSIQRFASFAPKVIEELGK
jgi:hypothetical protein